MINKRTYYRVVEDTPAWVYVGSVLGNTWVGNARSLDPVYAEILLRPDDEVHELPGGVFMVLDNGASFRGRLAPPDEYDILVKNYPRGPVIPASAQSGLRQIPEADSRTPASYSRQAHHFERDQTIRANEDPCRVALLLRPDLVASISDLEERQPADDRAPPTPF